MKKILLAILTLALVLSFTACLEDPLDRTPKKPVKKSASAIVVTPTESPMPTPTQTPTETPTLEITPSPTTTPTQAPTPTPISPTDLLTSGTNVYAFGGGQGSISFDLDGDGIDDNITYEFFGSSGLVPAGSINLTTPFLNMMDYDIYQCNITINGQPIIIQGEVIAGLVIIGDIDTSDSQYEIMIPEFGPSGDPQTTFIRYSGIAPQNIGKLYQSPLMNLRVDGSNLVTGQKRGTKLHTWFYNAKYRLKSGLIKEIKDDGLVLMDTAVTAKIDLPLQISPTDATAAFTLSVGENAIITLTDDMKWFLVETSGGLKGWFEITGFYTINGLPATDVFNGLSMAD